MAFYILVIMPVSTICPYCGAVTLNHLNCPCTIAFQQKPHPWFKNMPFNRSTKKTARLIYEPSLQGYSLSFSYNKDIVEFIKKAIPSNKRTYDPASYTWYFGSEYFDLIKLLFDGHCEYTLTIVSEDEVKKKLEEAQRTQSSWHPAQYSIDDELQKFIILLLPVTVGKNGDFTKEVKNWTKNDATKAYRRAAMFYHPDRNNGDGSKMSELNSTWAILKEGYYIK